jgi:hypothetical protein
MRRLSFFIIALLVSLLLTRADQAFSNRSQNAPKILKACMKGAKLIISGENFANTPVILINGQPQKTRSLDDSPATTLLVKNAANHLPPGEIASLQAQNPDGQMSESFEFFVGRTLTLDDNFKTVILSVGEKVQLKLDNGPYLWEVKFFDPNVLKRLEGEVAGAQGLFQAQSVGQTKLTAVGDPPCRSMTGERSPASEFHPASLPQMSRAAGMLSC